MDSTSFLDHFEELPDPRMERLRLHSLMDILFISVCAVICGATSFVDMHDFGCAKLKWFKKKLELKNGIPSHDTFRRVFSLIDPGEFRACFMAWTQAISKAVGGDIIALDGKTLRRSFDTATGLSAVHVLNAWSSANDFCVGQMKVDGKSNEITAMPELIKLMDIRGSVITADALNCQKEIASQIVEQGGDYVLALKNNQPSIYEDVKSFFEDSFSNGFDAPYDCCDTDDYGHGRVENRNYWSVRVEHLKWFKHKEWKGLVSIACVQSCRRTRDNESIETRYFITSLDKITKIARSIRRHWGVENKLHWIMDNDFGEDLCRVRAGHEPENLALLRQIAHNLIKQESSKNVSIRRKINKAGWDNDFLARIVAGV
ncbi:MAG: ISAs1 family transposase [Armatimonadota bacterium]|nr:ISAs1 family transposase [Armatimonadota bacterium]